MTRVIGTAIDPGSGLPVAGRLVYASLMPQTAQIPAPEGNPWVDEAITDVNGDWELNLQPTVDDADVAWRIRVWMLGTFWVDVPVAPGGNTPVELDDILLEPPDPPVPAPVPGPYVMRTELEQPGGVATLGSDGVLKLGQRFAAGPGGGATEWFAGDGPPPSVIPGAGVGDMYVDRLTGDLYQLL
jgi:hypothetical protein